MEKEKQKNNKNKKNTKVIVTISVLVLIIVGLLVYIAYDKQIIFKSIASVEEKKGGVVKKLDLSKSLNTKGIKYSSPTSKEGNYGLSMSINDDKKYVTLGINWPKFGPLSGASAYSENSEYYQINGFSGKVKSTFVGDLGQDSMGITLFFIMEDGSVYYMPMFINKGDHYEMNYQYNSDGKVDSFKVSGVLKNVEDAYRLYTVDASNETSRYKTTIAAKKDGSFYDLGAIINGNESTSKDNSKNTTNKEIDLSFDNSKVTNANGNKYYLNDGNSLGISVRLNDDKKSVDLTVQWYTIAQVYGNQSHPDAQQYVGTPYTINLSSEVVDIYLGGFGQDAGEETLFFIMKDKTVEYMPIKKATDTSDFKSYGKLPGVEKVIKLRSADTYSPQGSGWVTTLAATEDGDFIDLNPIIKATGNY